MQSALICQHDFRAWQGSEIVCCELAEALRTRGVDVTLLCNGYDARRFDAMNMIGVHVTDDPDHIDPFNFDLIYSHHHVAHLFAPRILDNVARKGRRFPVMVYAHLGPQHPLEQPGPWIEQYLADIVVANSPETQAHLAAVAPELPKACVVRNPAPERFFRDPATFDAPKQLNRILAVSNSFKPEILEALEKLEDRGISVTRLGKQFKARRITPELIAEHDAVLSIGKTAQYALAMRVPIFCYGGFGGPGWLDADNFEQAGHLNFSGRSHPQKMTVDGIAVGVTEGFKQATDFVLGLAENDLAEFRFETYIETLDSRVDALLTDTERAERLSRLSEEPVVKSRFDREHAMAVCIRNEYRKSPLQRLPKNPKRRLWLVKARRRLGL